MAQAFSVLLVIRNSEGDDRWMEVRDWLKLVSDDGKKPVKQIVFEGERFDVMSVRRWRDKILSNTLSTLLPPFQGLGLSWTVDPGRRLRTRFALGCFLSGFQP